MSKHKNTGALAIFNRELVLLNSNPLLWVSFIVISLVPAFYALTYLGSLWDPYEKLTNLPAGLVNLDAGTTFRGQNYVLGDSLVEELERRQTFGFEVLQQRQVAEEAVSRGDLYFALIIPAAFSERALPGTDTAQLELITSSGTSFTAALIAKKFTDVAVESLNHRLELERWEVVLNSGATALSAAKKLEGGTHTALLGSRKLSEGIRLVQAGVETLHTGQAKLADGLTGIDTEKLVSAGKTLHGGTNKLASGMAQHHLIDKLADIEPSKLEQLALGAEQYQSEIEKLARGLGDASAAASELQQGGERLGEAMSHLNTGSESLESGLEELHAGMAEFAAAFPTGNQQADNLSVSVTASHTQLNPAATNGQSFAPFIMAFAMWIGAMSASFVFLMSTFSIRLQGSNNVARVLGKETAPALMNVTGALILGVAIQWMTPPLESSSGYFLILVLAALTYNSIVLTLIRFLGDSGKLVALLLLVVQLASASGAYPIELSAPFYQAMSPHLPMTSVVDGLRAAMFGSFSGNWEFYAARLLPWLLGSLFLSHFAMRRATFVADEEYGPALRLAFGKHR